MYVGGAQTNAGIELWEELNNLWPTWWLQVNNRNGNDLQERTLIRTERCRQGAGVSFGSWPSLRERRTSYRWGSRCQAPTAGQPRGYPMLDWEESPSKTSACLARLAGNTWSGCSPGNKSIIRKNIRLLSKHDIVFCFNPAVSRLKEYTCTLSTRNQHYFVFTSIFNINKTCHEYLTQVVIHI